MTTMRPAPLSFSTKQKSVFAPGEVWMIQQQNIADAKTLQQQAEREESYRNGIYANRASIMEANARSSVTMTCDDEEFEYETFGKPSTKVGKIGKKVVKLKKKLQRKKEEKDPYAATHDRGNGAEKTASHAFSYLVPAWKHSSIGSADPSLDDILE